MLAWEYSSVMEHLSGICEVMDLIFCIAKWRIVCVCVCVNAWIPSPKCYIHVNLEIFYFSLHHLEGLLK